MVDIAQLTEDLVAAKGRQREADSAAAHIKHQMRCEIGERLKIQWTRIMLGGRKCEKSPIRVHVYDNYNPLYCLYCDELEDDK